MTAATSLTLSSVFNIIYEFRTGLMSMLKPSELRVFLPILGYKMSKAEERRYMSVDREVLKSTASIDRLMREGYQVLMLSTNFAELYKIMEGRQPKIGTWENRNIFDDSADGSYKSGNESRDELCDPDAEDHEKRDEVYGIGDEVYESGDEYYDGADKVHERQDEIPDKHDEFHWHESHEGEAGFASGEGNVVDPGLESDRTYSDSEEYKDRWWMPRRGIMGPYRVSVMFYITHPKFLHHNGHGETVTWNPDIPVALPGTWKRILHEGDTYLLDNEENPEDPDTHYVNGISGAKLQILREKVWDMDHFIWRRKHYPGHWDGLDGHLGCWNICTDIAEDCARICFFQRVPQGDGSKPFLLHCTDRERSFSSLAFLDTTILQPYSSDFQLQVLHLSQRPDKFETWTAWRDDHDYSDEEFRDLPMLENAAKNCHSVLITYQEEDRPIFIYAKIPLTIDLDD